eukprot:gene19346-biopygen2495
MLRSIRSFVSKTSRLVSRTETSPRRDREQVGQLALAVVRKGGRRLLRTSGARHRTRAAGPVRTSGPARTGPPPLGSQDTGAGVARAIGCISGAGMA